MAGPAAAAGDGAPSAAPCGNPGGERFDPFADRRAREIRNRLSRLFVTALRRCDPLPLAAWEAEQRLPPLYRCWVADRLARYRQVLAAIRGRRQPSVLAIFCQMWNKGLFFECHELAEEEWRHAPAAARPFWQGLVQAAGVYVHLERGAAEAAGRLGRKAVRNLRAAGQEVAGGFPLARLCAAIEAGGREPPHLDWSGA